MKRRNKKRGAACPSKAPPERETSNALREDVLELKEGNMGILTFVKKHVTRINSLIGVKSRKLQTSGVRMICLMPARHCLTVHLHKCTYLLTHHLLACSVSQWIHPQAPHPSVCRHCCRVLPATLPCSPGRCHGVQARVYIPRGCSDDRWPVDRVRNVPAKGVH